MTPRLWPAHATGLALCLVSFAYGYTQLAGQRAFASALHESFIVPLWGGAILSPITFAVGSIGIVLLVIGHDFHKRFLIVGAYSLTAIYWAGLATALADLDL